MDKKYEKYLRGKKVVLVGPAWHTKGTLQKKLIYSYDIIVRMNFSFNVIEPKIRKDIGNEINVWYSSLAEHFFLNKRMTYSSLKGMRKRGLKWIANAYVHHRQGEQDLKEINKKPIPLHRVDKAYFKLLQLEVGPKVSVGLITIYDLLQFDIKELYITGMSFYDTSVIGKRKTFYTGYHGSYGYKDELQYIDIDKDNHDFKKELKVFSRWYKSDDRVSCDEVLEKTMDK